MTTHSEDRFSQPKPKFIAPKDIHHVLTPPIKDHTPGTPLKDQQDNKLVKKLLEEAKALSGKILQELPSNKNKLVKLPTTRYCQAHILNDARFVEAARNLKITDKGAMSLLIANGGIKYLAGHKMLPAQAWDALRKEKLTALSRPIGKSFDRKPQYHGRAIPIKGTPTTEERASRIGMYLVRNDTIQEDKEQYHEETHSVD